MLHEFLTANRAELVALCKSKVALRRAFGASDASLESGIPRFIDQLIKTLEVEQTAEPLNSRRVSGPSGGGPVNSEIGTTAALHGRELLEHGYTVEQVVHDYGDLCQAVTELAVEHGEPIGVAEFQTLNRCLDNGIAGAVTEFGVQRDHLFANGGVRASNERLGMLAHELRNHIHSATLAVAALKTGYVGLGGATGGVLERSLTGMTILIDRSLADVRVTAGLPARHEVISLDGFIAEAGFAASLGAQAWECRLAVGAVDRALGVEVDRDLLSSAVGNLLQNAFKFTHSHTEVSLNAYASGDRIRIDVEDCCGGLPPGSAPHLFDPFTQSGTDRSGMGLGLAICKRSVEDNLGVLSVRDLPGKGCVFTIDLPRHSLPT
jgi:signal transduction histidine kinase